MKFWLRLIIFSAQLAHTYKIGLMGSVHVLVREMSKLQETTIFGADITN
jgi:hypothetical protein